MFTVFTFYISIKSIIYHSLYNTIRPEVFAAASVLYSLTNPGVTAVILPVYSSRIFWSCCSSVKLPATFSTGWLLALDFGDIFPLCFWISATETKAASMIYFKSGLFRFKKLSSWSFSNLLNRASHQQWLQYPQPTRRMVLMRLHHR